MPTFILQDASGIGSDDLDAARGFVDLAIIANDTGLGLDDPAAGMAQVTYDRTEGGPLRLRVDAMVNTAFSPDYGGGAQNVDTIVIAGLHGFTLDDGTPMADNGMALPPQSSGLPGAVLNSTEQCLVIYDTEISICLVTQGGDGTFDLPVPTPVVLYHELSHAFRIVQNTLLALSGTCNPSSPEENAAITDENVLRSDLATRQGIAPVLRDPGNHCGGVCGGGSGGSGGCCIIATLASGSAASPQVRSLRAARDHFVRGTEVGHAFFARFFRDYYAFSPQACTILAGDAALSRQVLEGFIEPLLAFWWIMTERSRRRMDGPALGAAFQALYPDRGEAGRRRAAMERCAGFWFGADIAQHAQRGSAEAAARLLALLRERAWPSEHMQWTLVAPVRIHHTLLLRHLAGDDAAAIGAEFARQLDAWAPEAPLGEIWAALSTEQVARELAFCDAALLQTPERARRFRERLGARFHDITAVAAVLERGVPEEAVP